MKASFHKAGSEKLQSLAKPMTFIKPSGFMNESLSCGKKLQVFGSSICGFEGMYTFNIPR